MNKLDNHNQFSARPGHLGTFAGVFTPSILTILGIILFLRLGYVVGSAGLMVCLIIIALANAISILTSFSLAAIATNFRVKGGGDYYLISRTLGLEYGGALGIVLFLAQSVSIAFYCMGFGEAVAGLIGNGPSYMNQLVAVSAVCFLFLLAWFGADLATKFQYLVMTILVLALASFYVGGILNWSTETLVSSWRPPEHREAFWILFAIFFPAVTGFTQGVSMSGDLKDPGKSLPLGTFMAVGLSILVYFSVALLFAAGRPLEVLSSNVRAMGDIAAFRIFIDAGVIAATLSSAMASFLGAPRILQSLSRDKIFTFLAPFSKGFGDTDNPRRGVMLSAVIALSTIALGQLDLVARLVSMFFLISYGLLNYATYFEAKAASPSFRPRFRYYHYHISLVGFLTCLGVMLAIDPAIGVTAIAILFAIYHYLKRTASPARWADSQRSHHLQQVRTNLISAESDLEHPRDWRPYILAFSDTEERRGPLLEFARFLEGGSGLTTIVKFLSGTGPRMRRARKQEIETITRDVRNYRNDVFVKVVSSPNTNLSLDLLIQSFGMGPVQANTILINWIGENGADEQKRILKYGQYLQRGHRMGCHLVILSATQESWDLMESKAGENKHIDVWWRGDASSSLMLLLAYLVTRNEKWRDAKIRVLATNYDGQSEENLTRLQEIIAEARIEAEPVLVDKAASSHLSEHSAGTPLTFLPFDLQEHEPRDMFGNPIDRLVDQLGVLALVKAGSEVELDAEPEEGAAAALADALDNLEHAAARVEKAQAAATEAAELARQRMSEIEQGVGALDEELLTKLRRAIHARKKAAQATRKHLREQAKFVEASEQAKNFGIELENDTEDPEQNDR